MQMNSFFMKRRSADRELIFPLVLVVLLQNPLAGADSNPEHIEVSEEELHWYKSAEKPSPSVPSHSSAIWNDSPEMMSVSEQDFGEVMNIRMHQPTAIPVHAPSAGIGIAVPQIILPGISIRNTITTAVPQFYRTRVIYPLITPRYTIRQHTTFFTVPRHHPPPRIGPLRHPPPPKSNGNGRK